MNSTISIREDQNKYRVYDGELQLACFGSKSAAEDYSLKQILFSKQTPKVNN